MTTRIRVSLRPLVGILAIASVLGAPAGWLEAQEIGYTSDGGALYEVDLQSGAVTLVGSYGLGGALVSALAFSPSGQLYGVDAANDQLVTVDPATGAASPVGPLGQQVAGGELTFDACGDLFLWAALELTTIPAWALLEVDPQSGAAATLPASLANGLGLAAFGEEVFAVSGTGGSQASTLFRLDPPTGALDPIAPLDLGPLGSSAPGLDFDAAGSLRMLSGFFTGPAPLPLHLFTIDTSNGSTTLDSVLSPQGGFTTLAIGSPPGACSGTPAVEVPAASPLGLALLALALGAAAAHRLRRG